MRYVMLRCSSMAIHVWGWGRSMAIARRPLRAFPLPYVGYPLSPLWQGTLSYRIRVRAGRRFLPSAGAEGRWAARCGKRASHFRPGGARPLVVPWRDSNNTEELHPFPT